MQTLLASGRKWAFLAALAVWPFTVSTQAATNAPVTLAEALDAPGLAFTTIGTPAWFGQTDVSHDGVDAAQTGAVTNGAAVTIQNILIGPGTLSFWWKVSSETNDYLKYYVNGVQQTRISGEVDWQFLSYDLPAGAQTSKWTYAKSATGAAGQDKAWLDQVQFDPGTNTNAVCSFVISPASRTHGSGSSTGNVSVAASAGCAWSTLNTNPWISVVTGASGTGNGVVGYIAQANPSAVARSGSLNIAGQNFLITQAGTPCSFAVAPGSAAFGVDGGSGVVDVFTVSSCSWSVINTNPWVSITSGGAGGTGNGMVSYSVGANSGGFRSGSLNIAGQTVSIVQTGSVPACTYAISPLSRAHGSVSDTNTVAVTAAAGCAWSVVNTNAWVGIISGASGTGSGPVTYATDANPSSGFRTGNLVIAGQVFSIVQTGMVLNCTYAITPASRTHGYGQATNFVTVTAPAGCAWSVINTNPWVTIVSVNGTGSGTVNYSVTANPTSSTRSGNILIAGEIFALSQNGSLGGACTYVLSPTGRSHGSESATGTVAVTAQAGCAWSVNNTNSWVTIVSATNGAGSGALTYTVDANPGAGFRTGFLSIGGQPFSIVQTGAVSAVISIPVAVDTDGSSLVWTTTGAASWVGQAVVTHDGVDAAISGAIADSTSSSVQTVVGGPGALSFWWKVSSEPNDILRFYVDGSEQTHISGEVDWQQQNATIAAGTHTLKWTYAKDAAGSAGQDRAWLDQVSYVPATGCSFSLSASNGTFSFGSVTGLVSVTAGAGCSWMTVKTNPWITIASGENGTNNGLVRFVLTANTASAVRTGVIVIAGIPYTVLQAPNPRVIHLAGWTPGGGVMLSVEGNAGRTNVVECTEDLIHWIPISTNSVPGAIIDGASTNAPHRFYRSYELP